MPVQQFMDSFFDSTKATCDKPEDGAKNWQTHFKSLGTFTSGIDICSSIRELITKSGAVPGMKVLQAWEEPNVTQSKTTLALFSNEDLLDATTPRSQLESMQLCITIKLTKQKPSEGKLSKRDEHKQYCNVSFGFKDGKKGCHRCRDELLSHAKTLLNHQHRTHAFMIHIADPHARLIRFDRDGAIVSQRFNYREHGGLLEFLWRYSTSSEEARGKDPTVTRATATEAALANEKLARWNHKNHNDRPVYKLTVQDQKPSGSDERKKMEVLVSTPVARPSSVTGRATKGYVGYDLGSGNLVFVKDSWRSTDPSMVKESDTLRTINSAGITEGVPVILCGDDLEGRWQSTYTTEYSHGIWNLEQQRSGDRRIHTRFVTDKVGTPLEDFRTSKDFLKAFYDAFLVHETVYQKCNIFHCDINLGNILVTANGKGFLNDWDLARTVEDIESGPERTFRTGTWRFMSAYVMARPKKYHALQDDIESFYWVAAFIIMFFLNNNWTQEYLKSVAESVFDERTVGLRKDGEVIGGPGKISNVMFSAPISHLPLRVHDNQPLTRFILQGRPLISSQYDREATVRDDFVMKTTERDMERDIYFAIKERASSDPLRNHEAFKSLLIETLQSEGWPTNDSAHDYLKDVERKGVAKRKADELDDRYSTVHYRDGHRMGVKCKVKKGKEKMTRMNARSKDYLSI
ncbi:hypothetical protein D9613_004759 [Agrocybe pediades]|uniref:Protein kinase domain-containing protein n=1 Tax=Agrocybe pediades TaxID=84607 RepID=A0A8H4VRG7_9AGAR|nr:hypothetical protein D9613_004759 [Agrocybe pediades]